MDGSPPDKAKPKQTPTERRARQRAANTGRAEKMHIARIADTAALPSAEPPRLNIGCSGWFYWDWKGGFYPTQMPTNQWFAHYADHFDTVEINASFYSWPTVAAVRKWAEPVRDRDFRFTVKVSELITHVRRFDDVRELILDFGYIADLLGPHMGCFLFQLPASFTYSPQRLDAIVRRCPAT
ncbi:hypothetical protein AEAC466_12835 [Asticcacaulis sp. AC466]|nr:DUF72 domain-containing protein [Asticcacaulis sp. AC466]ESQ83555.1 hypothetical protein AEAC466_12835 [Asticcacaulis sp. AC466]